MSTYVGEREFGRDDTTAVWQRRLDELIAARLYTNVEVWLYAGLLVVAIALRFTDLGTRALHHDESLHATFSYYLRQGKGYQHDPLMHGPFLFHVTALVYLLFGASDATSRFAPAFFGSLLVLLPLLLRPWLGRVGAFAAAAFIAFSPSLLYYSRFIRNEAWVAAWTLALFAAIFRYRASQRERWLYLGAAMLMLEFASKETAFLIAAIVVLYLEGATAASLSARIAGKRDYGPAGQAAAFLALLPVAWLAVCLWPFAQALRKRLDLGDELPADGVLLLVLGLLAVPQFSAAVRDPLQRLGYDIHGIQGYTLFGHPLTRMQLVGGLTVISMLALTFLIGLWWDMRRWFIVAAVFYIPYFLLYTTFLTNKNGWASGIWGSLNYWLDQQTVRRGNQPVFYFAMTIPVYEYLTLAFAMLGMFVHTVRRGVDSVVLLLFGFGLAAVVLPLVDGRLGHAPAVPVAFIAIGCLTAAMHGDPLRQFLIFYTGALLFGLSVAGEKMPWLTVHLALPVAVLAGLAANDLFAAALQLSPRLRRLLTVASLGAASIAALLAVTLASKTVGGGVRLLTAIVGFMLLGALVAATWRWLRTRLTPQSFAGRPALLVGGVLAGAALAGFLGVLTVRNDWRMNWVHPDTPDEMLIYTQTSPDVPKLAHRIDQLALESGLGRKLPITVDAYDSFTWPWAWYLRDYTNVGYPDLSFYANNPAGLSGIPVPWVLLLNANDTAGQLVLSQYPGQFGPGERYHHRWWFPEDGYRATTATKFFQSLRDVSELRRWWTYISNRDGFTVPPSDVSREGSRSAAVAQPASTPHTQALGAVDSYAYFCASWVPGKGVAGDSCAGSVASSPQATAVMNGSMLTLGATGSNPGQFRHPAGVAADAAGNIYVADTLNNRVQEFDASGKFVAEAGGSGSSVKLNQPWDVAVDRNGFVYVADTWNHRIVKLDQRLNQVTSWGQPTGAGGPSSPLDLYGPRSLAVDGAGNVWVTDTGNARLIEFDPTGNPLNVFGGRGSAPGQFDEPVGLTIADNGTIYVADTWNNRVQRFDASFHYLGGFAIAWAAGQAGHDSENKPYFAVLNDGSVLVSFPGEGRLVQYDAQGKVLRSINQLPGAVNKLQHPVGIVQTAAGEILLSDSQQNIVIRLPESALP